MHDWQPMHTSGSCTTMPSSRLIVAPVGHTLTQAGSSQWLHAVVIHGPFICCSKLVALRSCTSSGVRWRIWQAVTQVWQPMQYLWSKRKLI